MPRTKPLPQREQEICERLKSFRLARGLSRAIVAREMVTSQFTLANFERMHSPLRFALGYNLCYAYNISLRWLATGVGPELGFTPMKRQILDRAVSCPLFSEAYDLHLAATVDKELQREKVDSDAGWATRRFFPVGGDRGETLFDVASTQLQSLATTLPDAKQHSLAKQMLTLWETYELEKIQGKPMVDTPGASVKVAAVSAEIPTWKQLVKELKRLTSADGAKAQLAADLKTTRQNVHKWLSGAGAPSAELTLDVLRWVSKRQGK